MSTPTHSSVPTPQSSIPLVSTQHRPILPALLAPGHLTLLIGDPGIGKSLIATDLAARVSTFSPPPPAQNIPQPQPNPADIPEDRNPTDFRPGTAIILSRDDTVDTLAYRFSAAHDDFDFVKFPDADLSLVPPPHTRRSGRPQSFDDTATLFEWFADNISSKLNPRLFILDPLPAFLGTHDCGNQGSIRELIRPLMNLAFQYNFAVLGITHLKKSTQTQHPLHRAMGSLAYTALARTVLLLTPYHAPSPSQTSPSPTGEGYHVPSQTQSPLENPQAPTSNPLTHTNASQSTPFSIYNSEFSISPPTRLLLPIKSNLSATPPALGFSITSTPHGPALLWHPTPITDHPYANIDPHDALPERILRSQLELARDFLTITLAKGPIPSAQLLQQARAIGISRRTFDRARSTLEVRTFHEGISNVWLTALPVSTKRFA